MVCIKSLEKWLFEKSLCSRSQKIESVSEKFKSGSSQTGRTRDIKICNWFWYKKCVNKEKSQKIGSRTKFVHGNVLIKCIPYSGKIFMLINTKLQEKFSYGHKQLFFIYSMWHRTWDSPKNMLLLKNPQFLRNHYENW